VDAAARYVKEHAAARSAADDGDWVVNLGKKRLDVLRNTPGIVDSYKAFDEVVTEKLTGKWHLPSVYVECAPRDRRTLTSEDAKHMDIITWGALGRPNMWRDDIGDPNGDHGGFVHGPDALDTAVIDDERGE